MIPLPPDVWGEVLERLPIEELPGVTLTCHAFRRRGLPLLFKKFLLRPFCLDLGLLPLSRSPQGLKYMPSDEVVEDALKKLHFYASDAIAKHVQTCTIVPWAGSDPSSTSATVDCHHILHSFFELLSRFTNLKHLDCQAIYFNRRALSQLSLVSTLDSITLTYCDVLTDDDDDAPLPTISVRKFDLIYLARPEVLSQSGANKWLDILDEKSLQSLLIDPDRLATVVFSDLTSLKLFPALRTCKLPLSSSVMLSLPSILSQFPSLRRLDISQLGRFGGAEGKALAKQLHHSTPPPLVMYNGPFELLHLVVVPGMRSLSLFSFGFGGCDPDDLAVLFTAYKHSLKDLEFLRVKLTHLSVSFFATVCSVFPKLNTLYLDGSAGNTSFTPPDFLHDLPLDKLPKSIIYFLMDWTTQSREKAETESSLFKDRLKSHLPSLQFCSLIDWQHFSFLWESEKSGPGTITTQLVESLNDLYRMELSRYKLLPATDYMLGDA